MSSLILFYMPTKMRSSWLLAEFTQRCYYSRTTEGTVISRDEGLHDVISIHMNKETDTLQANINNINDQKLNCQDSMAFPVWSTPIG